jgi:hypothetical protein
MFLHETSHSLASKSALLQAERERMLGLTEHLKTKHQHLARAIQATPPLPAASSALSSEAGASGAGGGAGAAGASQVEALAASHGAWRSGGGALASNGAGGGGGSQAWARSEGGAAYGAGGGMGPAWQGGKGGGLQGANGSGLPAWKSGRSSPWQEKTRSGGDGSAAAAAVEDAERDMVEQAAGLKAEGNARHSAEKYQEAIECYVRAQQVHLSSPAKGLGFRVKV